MKVKIAVSALAVLALAGCGNQATRDLKGVPIEQPDKVRLIVNVDQYPNVVAMCIEGAGFAATTRDNSPAALQHIPAWDAANKGWCAE